MASGGDRDVKLGRRLLYLLLHPVSAGRTDSIFHCRHPGDGRYLLFVYGGQHRSIQTAAPEQGVLLSDPAFYRRSGDDVSDEAKRRGAGQYLYHGHCRAGDGVHHRVLVHWDGGRAAHPVSPKYYDFHLRACYSL